MESPSLLQFSLLITACIIIALVGLFILANFSRLLRGSIRNELLRKNILVWLIIFCFALAMTPMNGQFFYAVHKYGFLVAVLGEMLVVTCYTLIVFNAARWVDETRLLKSLSFAKRKLLVLLTIIVLCLVANLVIKYLNPDKEEGYSNYSLVLSMYFGSATGLVYILVSYLGLEQKRKFDEKELELSRLRELKAKAELDALHSKVNPHFLYNALNSIADLSITDGKKARKMTIALADLFRYSINYSNNNYSTVKEELEMSSVYLEIEKIRFEDSLTYTIQVEDGLNHYLVPRFVLQPLVENAVKHGLKATGHMTEVLIAVRRKEQGMILTIADNGPQFPRDLDPGYGVKSVYDKLDLLFPGQYEIHFSNLPEKQVILYIQKLMKNEPAI
ncbi:MAG TPA: histidine kinase [Chitinophagaceae bacterium]|nr:histidine kinase [Chitinophagaceae bacterium]